MTHSWECLSTYQFFTRFTHQTMLCKPKLWFTKGFITCRHLSVKWQHKVLCCGPWGSATRFPPLVDLHRVALNAYGKTGGKPVLRCCGTLLSSIKQATLGTFCLHRAERRCSRSQEHVFVRAIDNKTPVVTASPAVKILSNRPLSFLSSCLVFQSWKGRTRDLTPLTRHLQHSFCGETRLSVPLPKVLSTDV